MNGSSEGRPSPRNEEENMSMFFDFGTSEMEAQKHGSYQAMQSSHDVPRPGGIRVSLACIPVSHSFISRIGEERDRI
jgi:hypothetical protein